MPHDANGFEIREGDVVEVVGAVHVPVGSRWRVQKVLPFTEGCNLVVTPEPAMEGCPETMLCAQNVRRVEISAAGVKIRVAVE